MTDDREERMTSPHWQGYLATRQCQIMAKECIRRIDDEGREDLRDGVEALQRMSERSIWREKKFATEFGPGTAQEFEEPLGGRVSVAIVPKALRNAVEAVLFEILGIDVDISTKVWGSKDFLKDDPVHYHYSERDLDALGFDSSNSNPRGDFFEIFRWSEENLVGPFLENMWQLMPSEHSENITVEIER